MKVDLVASERHYFDHAYPAWRALPAGARGQLLVHGGALERAREGGLDAHLPSEDEPWHTGDVVLAAGWKDLLGCHRRYKKRVLMEHGAGQTYSVPGFNDPSYAGAPGREMVDLFLCPNERVAHLNRVSTPRAESVVVGTPALDKLFTAPRHDGERWVCVTSHWRCRVCDETRGAVDWIVPGALALLNEGWHVFAHSHPRAREEVQALCLRAGVNHAFQPTRGVGILACDNSSLMFEHAALGGRVIVMTPPWFRRSVDHGLRFWEYAALGPEVTAAEQLPAAATLALDDSPEWEDCRARMTEALYPVRDGSASKRAAEALLSL